MARFRKQNQITLVITPEIAEGGYNSYVFTNNNKCYIAQAIKNKFHNVEINVNCLELKINNLSYSIPHCIGMPENIREILSFVNKTRIPFKFVITKQS